MMLGVWVCALDKKSLGDLFSFIFFFVLNYRFMMGRDVNI